MTPSRRFRFSLRTLFVVVTVVCLWLGRQTQIVQERRDMIARIIAEGGDPAYKYRNELIIALPEGFSDDEMYRVENLFPEYFVFRLGNRPERAATE